MKRFFFMLAPLLLSALFSTSCINLDKDKDGDTIWDIYPVVIKMYVYDENGADLLDPQYSSTLKLEDISLTYLEKEYTCSDGITADPLPAPVETKAYMPQFYGLWRQAPYTGETKYSLFFGELDGAKSYDNAQFVLKIGNGTTHTIVLKRDFKWEDDGSPSVNQKWYLDGEEAQLPFSIFVR